MPWVHCRLVGMLLASSAVTADHYFHFLADIAMALVVGCISVCFPLFEQICSLLVTVVELLTVTHDV